MRLPLAQKLGRKGKNCQNPFQAIIRLKKMCVSSLREGVKKNQGPVRKRGEVNPQSATKIVFYLEKRKKMQNVLKRKNKYFDYKTLRTMFIWTCFMFLTIPDLLKCILKNDKIN